MPIDRQAQSKPWNSWAWRYVATDALASALAWAVLFTFRKAVVEPRRFGMEIDITPDENFWKAMVVVPLFWVALHACMGMYLDVRQRHRGLEVRQSFRSAALGGVLLFFLLLLDDVTRTHVDHYETLGVWMGTHLTLILGARWAWTSRVVRNVQNGTWAYSTLVVGDESGNAAFLNDVSRTPGKLGWNVVATRTHADLKAGLKSLESWLDTHPVDRAVLTTRVGDDPATLRWIALLEGRGVDILVVPGALDYMAGTVRSSNLFGVPLVNLSKPGLTAGMRVVKRTLDVVLSALALVVLSPLLVGVAMAVRRSSPGPVFYRQERLGLHGRPFKIVKFRTMVVDAEGMKPRLSSYDDPRITAVGKKLRQTRVDELPQFWNVLKGDMSLVGPRPERAFFTDQIVCHSPQFLRLQQVRPGITSWGQVKYGYAENVEQMRQRLRYDIMYLENISLLLDLKILLYTVRTVVRREGK